jgi:hypothetical protein
VDWFPSEEKAMNATMQGPRLGFKRIIFLSLALILSFHFPQTQQSRKTLYPGLYVGVFTFNINHTFNTPVPPNIKENYYSLEVPAGVGEIRFAVETKGTIRNIQIKVESFSYGVVSSLSVDYPDMPCKGYVAHGGGMANLIKSGAMPPAAMGTKFMSSPMKIDPGKPWGFATSVGDCGGNPPKDSFKEAILADFNAMPASPWEFTPEFIEDDSISGTCTSAIWTTVDRSIDCIWMVNRK